MGIRFFNVQYAYVRLDGAGGSFWSQNSTYKFSTERTTFSQQDQIRMIQYVNNKNQQKNHLTMAFQISKKKHQTFEHVLLGNQILTPEAWEPAPNHFVSV